MLIVGLWASIIIFINMTSINFCYWLQGWFEINGDIQGEISGDQLETIQRHLNMVFIHDIDPKMGGKEHQQALTNAHNKPKLDELIPDAGVIYSNVPLQPKPDDWKPGWKHSPLYGWYDPQYGVPRC